MPLKSSSEVGGNVKYTVYSLDLPTTHPVLQMIIIKYPMVYELNSCTLSPMLPVFFGLLVPVGSRSSHAALNRPSDRATKAEKAVVDKSSGQAGTMWVMGPRGALKVSRKWGGTIFHGLIMLDRNCRSKGKITFWTRSNFEFQLAVVSAILSGQFQVSRATTAFPWRARLNRSLAPRAGSMGHCLVDIWYGQLCLHDTHELWIFSRQKFSYCLQHPATDASWPLVFAVPEVPLHHVSYGGGSWIQVERFSGPQT